MILRRRGFMAKNDFFLVFGIWDPIGSRRRTMEIFFRYFLRWRIRKIKSKIPERTGTKSKILPKLGVEKFFFEISRNWPRFVGLKDVKLNSESNDTG